MAQPQVQRLWERDELEVELRAALELVEALQPPEDLRGAVFTLAGTALLQRIIAPQPRPVVLDPLRGLPRLG